jgi:segregation and condensation protein A
MDPRAELIRRLLEYQKYKKVAAELAARDLRGRDIFVREVPAPRSMEPAPLREFSIFKLLEAFQKVLDRTKYDDPFEISAEQITIQARMSQITETLRAHRRCSFFSLFDEARSTYDVVVTFLAVLEMTKMRITRLYQSDHNAEIHLEYRVIDDDSDVDTHDAPHPETAPEPGAAPDSDPSTD